MTVRMRDGQLVTDPRLGRLRETDPRSRRWPLRGLMDQEGLDSTAVRSWTWTPGGSSLVPLNLDQGSTGGCVSWTIAHARATEPRRVPVVTNGWALENYYQIQEHDQWAGSARPGDSPNYEGTSVTAGAEWARACGHFTEYRWADLDDPHRAIQEIKATVSWKGAVPWGIDWHEGMFNVDARGFIHVTGAPAGGHSILICGNNERLKAFKLWNSWSVNWGVYGWCWISWEDALRLQGQGGEAYFPVKAVAARKPAEATDR